MEDQPKLSEEERLQKRMDEMAAKGVYFGGFFWGDKVLSGEATVEEVAAELNRALDAIENGDYEEVTDIDSDIPQVRFDAPFVTTEKPVTEKTKIVTPFSSGPMPFFGDSQRPKDAPPIDMNTIPKRDKPYKHPFMVPLRQQLARYIKSK